MGSKFICEKATHEVPRTAIATWVDDNECYYIREATERELSLAEKEIIDDFVYQAGTSSAVWAIGSNVICKVKTWCDGMELESETLAFLTAKFPHIPIPEVVHSWLDRKLNRTFLLLKRINARALDDAWPSLSSEQKHHIATTVAQYLRDLATLQSSSFQSATERGILEPFLNVYAEDSYPSWKPRLLGPFSLPIFKRYLQRISRLPAPLAGDTFHFYHADLGPTNILVSEDGQVKAVLDWESAGFYPRFWISLKPYISAGFYLAPTATDRYEWVDILEEKLSAIGFELNAKHVEWNKCVDLQFF